MSPESFMVGFATAVIAGLAIKGYMLKGKKIWKFVRQVKSRIFK